jgi:hypothetical protein
LLAENAFQRRLQLWAQDGGDDDGGIRGGLDVGAGIGAEKALHESAFRPAVEHVPVGRQMPVLCGLRRLP